MFIYVCLPLLKYILICSFIYYYEVKHMCTLNTTDFKITLEITAWDD